MLSDLDELERSRASTGGTVDGLTTPPEQLLALRSTNAKLKYRIAHLKQVDHRKKLRTSLLI